MVGAAWRAWRALTPREAGGAGVTGATRRAVRRALSSGASGADCAVGSGQWAEPPHPPWALHRRGGPEGTFWAPAGGPPPDPPEDQSPEGGVGGLQPTVRSSARKPEQPQSCSGLPAPRRRKSQRSGRARGNAEWPVRVVWRRAPKERHPSGTRSKRDRTWIAKPRTPATRRGHSLAALIAVEPGAMATPPCSHSDGMA